MPVASAPPDGVLPKPEDISICKRLGGCFGELADGRLAGWLIVGLLPSRQRLLHFRGVPLVRLASPSPNCAPLKSSCASPFPTLRPPRSSQSKCIATLSNFHLC